MPYASVDKMIPRQTIRKANLLGSVWRSAGDVPSTTVGGVVISVETAALFSGFEIEVVIPNGTVDRTNRAVSIALGAIDQKPDGFCFWACLE